MDPVSQAVVAGVAGQNVIQNKQSNTKWLDKGSFRIAGVLAFLSGMLADLDVLISSTTDPLLSLEYHRQFTHSILFMPLGGLLAALLLYAVWARRYLCFMHTYLFCTAGYITHGLLDACTSYGTQLFWPFSDMRIAWNIISIIDPVFTLPLFVLFLLALVLNKPGLARAAAVYGLVYLSIGIIQQQRAITAAESLAANRGHIAANLQVKPSFANNIVWKIIYEHEQQYHVDAIRLGWSPQLIEGESVPKLEVVRDFPWLEPLSQQAQDIERFRHFSAGYLAVDRQDNNTIVDMRYSMLPNTVDALWGIKLSTTVGESEHVQFLTLRNPDERDLALKRLQEMVFSADYPSLNDYQDK